MAEIRGLLPTTLGSAAIRAEIAQDLRARSVFAARAANLIFVSKIKEVVTAVAAGRMDKASARAALLETLRVIGYTPEGGFPDTPSGQVPPAILGTLQDLSSHRRLSLIVDTQVALMAGRGQQLRGMEPARMAQYPAWELVRSLPRRSPRNWGDTQLGSPPRHQGKADIRSRWTISGGSFVDGRLIALKGDPVWGELGSSENFDDALDTDYPPFAFQSGMGWREIDRKECTTLALTGPDGQSLDDWLAVDHPVISTPPPPAVSVRGADPALVRHVTQVVPPAVLVGATLTPPAHAAAVEDRQRAIRQRAEDRLAAAIARRQSAYARQSR